ncbi:hemerythrin domain-containing protein [Avibacterium sp. 21-595]|uniref:hemerythrin domain-containing protein n=1 Tax=Avibacterium sp. 21-595 TaxID=2911527 RepID=UPI002026500C|nr:hemerythrin domain-containing protein [Avibacterium sp. 21-595]URL05851.1 hemerythrin domain-containing protein [Avibacterium sp. 21-595]
MLNLQPQQFASWNEPIEMLYACHGKVKMFCRQLNILPSYLEKNGNIQAVQKDVQQILNYFNVAAPLHHDDEEKDFFPALLKYCPQAKADVARLASQHETLHQNWASLSVQLDALLKGEITQIPEQLITQFIAGYDNHIAIEEPLFELGKSHIPQEELTAMGKVMAERRKN